jgi:DNA-binding GntR family transcriptional regulator
MTDAVERAYAAIRAAIFDGRYQGGLHLKGADLASNIGVSRTPVREALRRLHAEGLVNFVTNHGAFVTSWTRADLDEVFGLRTVLESHAVELATRRLTDDQIGELAVLAETTERLAHAKPPDFLARIAEANSRLHGLIIQAAGNRRLGDTLARLFEVPMIMRTFQVYSDEDLHRSAAHHRELVAAFRARDPLWAASVMHSHIRAAYHVMLTSGAERGNGQDRAVSPARAGRSRNASTESRRSRRI